MMGAVATIAEAPPPHDARGAALPGMLLAATLEMFSDVVLVAELRRRGWVVEKAREEAWTSPGELSVRVGFTAGYISRCIDRGIPVPGLEVDRGPTGRIRSVRPSGLFFEWAENRRARTRPVERLER